MDRSRTCPLCGAVVSVLAADARLHLPPHGPVRWAAGCPSCGVLAVLPADDAALEVLLLHARCTSGPRAPWDDDDLGHDAVCVASALEPEHDVHAPPLDEDEVAALVARLDDLLDA